MKPDSQFLEPIDANDSHLESHERAIQQRIKIEEFHKKTGSETIGIGLTSSKDDTIQIQDILTPDPLKTLIVESSFISSNEAKLIEFLTAYSGQAKVIYNPASKELIFIMESQEFIFNNLSIEFITKVLNGLTGQSFDLNKGLDIAIPEVNREAIFYGSKIFMSGSFIERVKKEAIERELRTDYIIHHHPVLFMLRWLTHDKSRVDRVEVYDKSLEHTESDINVAKQFNAKVLEIRALGTVDDIMNEDIFTSNFVAIPSN